MTRKSIYYISVLLLALFCLPSAAQDLTKPVWAFHNGGMDPYATFDNIYSALNNATLDGTNPNLAGNDIIELHADVHEPDDFRNHPAHNTIDISLTIRSEEGEKYTVYSPATGDASQYFQFGAYKGSTGLTLTFQDITFDNSGFTNSPYFLYLMWNNEDIIMNNVDVIGGGGITGFAGYSNLQYAYDNDYVITNCTFKDIPTTVISFAPYKDEERVTMSGCTIENCGTAVSLSGQGSGYIGGKASAVLDDVKISGCERCFFVTAGSTCEINGDETLISGNGQVLEQGGNSVVTINDGTFSDNHTTGNVSVFSMSDDAQKNHSTTLIINGGSFIDNSTEEGGVFQQYRNGKLQLHGGYFEGNNTDRKGEVICLSNVNVLGQVLYEYGELDLAGDPYFDDGQYIHLEKWMSADVFGGYEHDQYDLVQHIIKDGTISPSAHINVSTEFGNGFHGTQDIDILVPSPSATISAGDADAFSLSYTDIYEDSNPLTANIEFGSSQDHSGKSVIKFTNYTTIVITRYDLQENDSAIFNIYQETSPGTWEKVHSVSLTGKATGTNVRRVVQLSRMGNIKIVETDFNYKYAKTGTLINGTPCATQGEGTASGSYITFEVHGEKIHHEGTEDIKKNIFQWRDNPWY